MGKIKPVKVMYGKDVESFYLKIRKKIVLWMEEGKLKKKSGKWTDSFVEYLLIFPDMVHLMIKLFSDKDVSPRVKGYIVIGLAYFISPIDFIPDFIPVAGLIDDLLVSVIIVNKIINSGDELLIKKVKKYWAGESDVFKKVQEIVSTFHEISSQIPKFFFNFLKKSR